MNTKSLFFSLLVIFPLVLFAQENQVNSQSCVNALVYYRDPDLALGSTKIWHEGQNLWIANQNGMAFLEVGQIDFGPKGKAALKIKSKIFSGVMTLLYKREYKQQFDTSVGKHIQKLKKTYLTGEIKDGFSVDSFVAVSAISILDSDFVRAKEEVGFVLPAVNVKLRGLIEESLVHFPSKSLLKILESEAKERNEKFVPFKSDEEILYLRKLVDLKKKMEPYRSQPLVATYLSQVDRKFQLLEEDRIIDFFGPYFNPLITEYAEDILSSCRPIFFPEGGNFEAAYLINKRAYGSIYYRTGEIVFTKPGEFESIMDQYRLRDVLGKL